MTVTRYGHTDPLRQAEVGLYIMRAALERPYGETAKTDLLDYLPADLREGVIVLTAPTEDHFAVRDLLVEFFKLEGAYRGATLAGLVDGLDHFNLAMAAYQAGKADCDCRDD